MSFVWKLLLLLASSMPFIFFAKATTGVDRTQRRGSSLDVDGRGECLSWRLAVETNNMRAWPTVPAQCLPYLERYMLGGQYDRDLDIIVDQIYGYLGSISQAGDGKDAWVLDVDDTCISNLPYYREKRFGCDPFDPAGFKSWARRGACPAIPQILGVYRKLIECGFKVFLLTGRDEELLGSSTATNLYMQGFVGHEKLMMRSPARRGQGASTFKSAAREELVAAGYRIHGNIGDQWSDLTGDCVGYRTFKLPNPMYFVP